MTCTCSPSNQLSASHPTLWAVKTYLDLISKSDRLIPGTGLRRLYSMTHGLATLNETDIVDMTNKAQSLGLIPKNLDGFMNQAILKNCYIYGGILSDNINDRIIGIANGDIQNPVGSVRFNEQRARRAYYVPAITFIKRLQKALKTDFGSPYRDEQLPAISLEQVSEETFLLLGQYQRNEGTITDQETAYGALIECVEKLLSILQNEAMYVDQASDYRKRSRHALRILWFIAKLLNGDLTDKPARGDLARVDLENKINMSDGTLAAIPFPIKQSVSLFEDYDAPSGVTMKGRIYLAAVAAAAFHRCIESDEG